MPRLTTTSIHSERLDSDAEALHFPRGGVFGLRRPPENRFRIGVPDAVNEVTRTLMRMQDQINRLREQVDQTAENYLADTWPPKAA